MKNRIVHFVVNVFLMFPAIFFLYTGFRWLVSPEDAAGALLMPLLSGSGLSSQIGDIGGMFLALGITVMGAVVMRKGEWLVPVAIVLGCIALFRLLAFSLHGAPFLPQAIAFEITMSIWFGFAAQRLKPGEAPDV